VAEKARANDFQIVDYSAIDPQELDQIKAALAQGNPVIFSIVVRPAFFTMGRRIYASSSEPPVTYKKGKWKDYPASHALTLVGYDDERQAFRFINSWNTDWGDRGYGSLSYGAFKKDVDRAYVMVVDRVAPPVPPPKPQPEPTPSPKDFEFVGCGLVDTIQTDRGLEVRGVVETNQELERVTQRAKELNAAAVDVAVRKWPQCEALMTLRRGLHSTDRPRVKVLRSGSDGPLAAGSQFLMEVESPSTPSFLHVAYIQADGTAVNLLQAKSTSLTPIPPRTKVTLGDGRNGGPKLTVSAPFGEEVVIVVSSKAPLFGEERPTTETERGFLTALRTAVLARPDPSSPERIFSADYEALVTVDSKQ
jgi:hypothetical protein